MKTTYATALAVMVLLMMGCSKKVAVEADGSGAPRAEITGETAKPGALLAYEHHIWFRVAPDSMTRRISAVQAACNEERFGACSVLGIDASTGDDASATIKVRLVPTGVEKLVALAAEGDTASKRQTQADDLADAVADVASQQDLLSRQRETLLGYVQRKDIAVADMIAVSQQLANIESMLHGLAQQSTDQRRRIETNLLTIDLHSNISSRAVSDFSFGDAWWTFVDSLAEGATAAAEYAGFLLPLILLAFPAALLWRWGWRRATGQARKSA